MIKSKITFTLDFGHNPSLAPYLNDYALAKVVVTVAPDDFYLVFLGKCWGRVLSLVAAFWLVWKKMMIAIPIE